jgi:Ca2+-binding EF-hand superfamily protein
LDKIWSTFDSNGNGICSLAEIDRAILMLLPSMHKHKPAIMRAYKAADTDNNGFITKKEFAKLIKLLSYFDGIYCTFKEIDTNGDSRISYEEFLEGAVNIGLVAPQIELKRMFNELDRNKGGYILFDEFCFGLAKQAANATVPPKIQRTSQKKASAAPAVAAKPKVFFVCVDFYLFIF